MSAVIFNVGSVTNAMRGKALLEKNEVSATVGRAIDGDGNTGCGYTLTVYTDHDKAAKLLQMAGIRIRGVMRR